MHPNMSTYETRAWDAMLQDEIRHRNSIIVRVGDKVEEVAKRASDQIRKNPIGEKILDIGDDTITRGLEGAFKAIFMPAVRSASLDRRIKKLVKRHPECDPASPFLNLDLKQLDKGRPTLVIPFVGALESAGASLAVTGATVSTTVSGGATAAVVVGAIAADTAASLALLGRSVAEVATHYGFDPREPEEELFLMGVLNYSMATSAGSKAAALASLSRLAQQMMRRATWNQLGKDPLVRLLQKIFEILGLRLTHARLANLVPIAGGVVTAGLSFNLLKATIDDATRLYRARYLAEKYDLTFDTWVAAAHASTVSADSVGDASEAAVSELIDDVVAASDVDQAPA
ncbi:EcsC family protein [Pseudolysinimonas sp.]